MSAIEEGEEIQRRREEAAEEWDAVCRHDQDVPHFSGSEEDFMLWIAQVLCTRRKVRKAYGWECDGTIHLINAIAADWPDEIVQKFITPEDLWAALALGGGEAPKPDGTNDEEIAEWARLMKLAEPGIPDKRWTENTFGSVEGGE